MVTPSARLSEARCIAYDTVSGKRHIEPQVQSHTGNEKGRIDLRPIHLRSLTMPHAGPDNNPPCGSGKDATCCTTDQCCVTDSKSCGNGCPSSTDDHHGNDFVVLLEKLFGHRKDMDGTCQCEPGLFASLHAQPDCGCIPYADCGRLLFLGPTSNPQPRPKYQEHHDTLASSKAPPWTN